MPHRVEDVDHDADGDGLEFLGLDAIDQLRRCIDWEADTAEACCAEYHGEQLGPEIFGFDKIPAPLEALAYDFHDRVQQVEDDQPEDRAAVATLEGFNNGVGIGSDAKVVGCEGQQDQADDTDQEIAAIEGPLDLGLHLAVVD